MFFCEISTDQKFEHETETLEVDIQIKDWAVALEKKHIDFFFS
jgi:hypothetical protein